MKAEYTCIVCPVGCSLTVTAEGDQIVDITGCECQKGKDYAAKEHTNPERMLTTTVCVEGGVLPLVPVRTTDPIPKGLMLYCMDELAKVRLAAPVKEGEPVVKDILGTGVSVIATRSIPAVGPDA